MINQIDNPQTTGNKKIVIGIIILAVGTLLLLNQLNFLSFQVWAITWPLGLIGFGLYTGFKHNFKKLMWIVYTMVGLAFLLPNIIPAFSVGTLWPLGMIGYGVFILLRRNQRWNGQHWEKPAGNANNIDNNIQ
jgi:hypothetical protein